MHKEKCVNFCGGICFVIGSLKKLNRIIKQNNHCGCREMTNKSQESVREERKGIAVGKHRKTVQVTF